MPDNRWGAGKVNAYGALAKLLGVTGNKMTEMLGKTAPVLTVISVAGKRFLSIERPQKINGVLRLYLYNSAGRKVMNVDCHENRISLPTSLAQGVYIADILCNGKTVKSKIILY